MGVLSAVTTVLAPVRTVVRDITWPGGGGRRQRRTWVGPGRAHLEVRGAHVPDQGALREHLVEALNRVEGVRWAEVNAVLGRVVVAFDDEQLDADDLVEVVEGIEEAHDVQGEGFPSDRAEHPGDREPLDRQLVALAADVLGIGVGTTMRLARSAPLSAEIASVLALVDATPRLRRQVENLVGRATADVGLAIGSAVAQGLAQGPVGLLTDGAHRVVRVRELAARRAVWERREPELHTLSTHGAPGPDAAMWHRALEPRPAPLPPGPVERHGDRAAAAGLAATVTALAVTRDWRPAVAALSAATPKAAHLGREAFAAHLGVVLAGRDVIPMDGEVLRRLDRIDTVVLDADLLMAPTWTVTAVAVLDGGPVADCSRHARTLLDPHDPAARGSRGRWRLHPLGREDERDERVRATARAARRPGARLLALRRADEVVAVVTAERALDPLAETLVAAARTAADVVIGGTSYGVAERLHVADAVPGGRALRRSVRDLQSAGHAVALASAQWSAALAAADCGIGVLRPEQRPPWGAHLLCGPGLEQACRLLAALRPARQVSSLAVTLATYGSGVGALLAFTGPRAGASGRAMHGVNGAALAAIATGVFLARRVGQLPDPVPIDPTAWHELDRETVLAELGSRADGLTNDEARRRLRTSPAAASQAPPNVVNASLEELANPLTPALAGGAGLSALGGSVVDAALIGAVMGFNALLGGVQRVGADRALRRLVDVSAVRVHLHRDGTEITVTTDELVAGDVISLEAGDAVPADCRILEARGLEVDESSLTGESQLVAKTARPVAAAAVADRLSMLYEGTTVAAGHAVALVVATGPATELGRAARAAATPRRPGGVQARLQALTRLTVPLALGAGAGLVGAGLLRGTPVRDTLGTGVSLAVAAVPEGLPIVASLAQLSAAKRLSRRNALVRNASTVEALGRVDVLCFDKTGTLTEGRLSLQTVWDGDRESRLDALDRTGRQVLTAALRATPDQAGRRRTVHPTDRAVSRGAGRAGVSRDDAAGAWRLTGELPFEPSRSYHAVVAATPDGQVLSVKGAPEVVLPRCESIRRNGTVVPLDDAGRSGVAAEVDRLARRGYRVLAVAERRASGRQDLDDRRVVRLELSGLLALNDPVRPTAAAAVRGVLDAGVEVVVLTGDHPSTAEAIAAELGLLNGQVDGQVATGTMIDALGDDELVDLLARCSVFARVSPEHKVRIVRVLQQAGRVVAVTGDGANDAPAIRLADVGVALGRRATNATKEAADLVVTDDALETIIDAIVEGRATWASVRDAVALLLGGNLGEIVFTIGAGLLPGGPPLNARQLLLVNLLTDLLPSTALAVRPPRSRSPEDLLREGPDMSLGPTLVRDVLIRGGLTAAAAGAGWTVARATGSGSRAGTVALVALVGAQLGQTAVLGLRSPLVVGASLASGAVLAAVVQTPGVSQFFGSRPLGPTGWAIGLGAAGAATAASIVAPAVVRRFVPDPTPPEVRRPRGQAPIPAPRPAANGIAPPADRRRAPAPVPLVRSPHQGH